MASAQNILVTTPTSNISNVVRISRQRKVWDALGTRMAAAGGSCGVDNAIHLAQRHKNVKALALLAGDADRSSRTFLSAPGAPPVFTAAAADDRYADFVSIMSWIAGFSKSPQRHVAHYADGGHAAVVFAKHPGLADTIANWFAVVLKARTGALPRTNGAPLTADVMRTLQDVDAPRGAAAVSNRLTAARRKNPRAQLFPEYFVNLLGYEHLASNDTSGALAIMQFNVQTYPPHPMPWTASVMSTSRWVTSRPLSAMLPRERSSSSRVPECVVTFG